MSLLILVLALMLGAWSASILAGLFFFRLRQIGRLQRLTLGLTIGAGVVTFPLFLRLGGWDQGALLGLLTCFCGYLTATYGPLLIDPAKALISHPPATPSVPAAFSDGPYNVLHLPPPAPIPPDGDPMPLAARRGRRKLNGAHPHA